METTMSKCDLCRADIPQEDLCDIVIHRGAFRGDELIGIRERLGKFALCPNCHGALMQDGRGHYAANAGQAGALIGAEAREI
jgi:hypothetical protein